MHSQAASSRTDTRSSILISAGMAMMVVLLTNLLFGSWIWKTTNQAAVEAPPRGIISVIAGYVPFLGGSTNGTIESSHGNSTNSLYKSAAAFSLALLLTLLCVPAIQRVQHIIHVKKP
jgi:hypothetical protein